MKRQRAIGLISILIIAAILSCGFLVAYSRLHDRKTPANPIKSLQPSSATPSPTGAQAKFLFAGTTFWGRRTNTLARASGLGVKYPFSELHTLNRKQYDAWITGLECPITDNGHTYYNEYELLKFNCDPDYLPELKNWVTAMMLGTNHTDNWGPDGFAQTKEHLKSAGIQYFGHYDYGNATENCGVVVLPIRLQYQNQSPQVRQMPFGMCSAHGVFGVPTAAALANIQRYVSLLPTIVMPHMGAEYQPRADELRTNLYRKMIDLGAEMVIADHPHWIQNTEAYQGRLIAYSLGNFMFDQQTKETTRSATIEANGYWDKSVNFAAWHRLGQYCLKNQSSCLTKIQQAGLQKPPIKWQFDFHGTTSANSAIPRLASPAEQQEISQRLNWEHTMSGLK